MTYKALYSRASNNWDQSMSHILFC